MAQSVMGVVLFLHQTESVVVEGINMSTNKPIKDRQTEHTGVLLDKYWEFVANNKAGIIEIDLDVNIDTAFPVLSRASKSLSLAIVDPRSVMQLVQETLPELDENEKAQNSNIIFEQQALSVIEATMYGTIQCLTSLLQPYFPRSEDFEEAFKKALVKIKPFIDSLAVDYDSKLKAQLSNATDEKFDEIINQLNQEDE